MKSKPIIKTCKQCGKKESTLTLEYEICITCLSTRRKKEKRAVRLIDKKIKFFLDNYGHLKTVCRAKGCHNTCSIKEAVEQHWRPVMGSLLICPVCARSNQVILEF